MVSPMMMRIRIEALAVKKKYYDLDSDPWFHSKTHYDFAYDEYTDPLLIVQNIMMNNIILEPVLDHRYHSKEYYDFAYDEFPEKVSQ